MTFKLNLRRESWFIFFAGFVLYSTTMSENLGITHDSAMYLNWFKHEISFFMPHHLLYHVIAFGWLRFWQWTGLFSTPEFIVAWLNALAGSGCLVVVYRLLRNRADLPITQSLIATGLIAVSYGFWFYSVAVEVYLIPLFFLLLTFSIITAPTITTRRVWAAAICHALAVLFHQSNVLFYLPVVTALWIQTRVEPIPRWRTLLTYTGIVTLLTVIPYLLVIVYYVDAHSVRAGWDWLTLYSHELPDTWQPLALSTLGKVIIGAGRAFVGGQFLFALHPLQHPIQNALAGHWLNDEAFLVRNMPNVEALGLSILLFILIISIVRLLFMKKDANAEGVARPHRMPSTIRSLVMPVGFSWLITYAIFFFFWDPTNNEFWIPQSVVFWILLALFAYQRNWKLATRWLSVGLISLFLVNFLGTIVWAQSRTNDYYYNVVEGVVQKSGGRDLLIVRDEWMLKGYVDYYSNTPFLTLTSAAKIDSLGWTRNVSDSINHHLNLGGRVYVFKDAVEMSAADALRYKLDMTAVNSLWPGYAPKMHGVKLGLDTVYIITN